MHRHTGGAHTTTNKQETRGHRGDTYIRRGANVEPARRASLLAAEQQYRFVVGLFHFARRQEFFLKLNHRLFACAHTHARASWSARARSCVWGLTRESASGSEESGRSGAGKWVWRWKPRSCLGWGKGSVWEPGWTVVGSEAVRKGGARGRPGSLGSCAKKGFQTVFFQAFSREAKGAECNGGHTGGSSASLADHGARRQRW